MLIYMYLLNAYSRYCNACVDKYRENSEFRLMWIKFALDALLEVVDFAFNILHMRMILA